MLQLPRADHLTLHCLLFVALLCQCSSVQCQDTEPQGKPAAVLDAENLVAWCIVPFDAKQRTPAERAEMLHVLGVKRCAYDWRANHVPTFEQEILEYKRRGIEFFAFWDQHDEAFRLFEKYDLHPQIWRTLSDPGGDDIQSKVERAAKAMEPLAQRTAALKCKLGLYNHGGWGGEPENMVAVCQRMHQMGYPHVGIVYNFHHGHDHIEDWPKALELMQPMLHCLNLNGMNTAAQPKILGISHGQHELKMIKAILDSGYQGPIGVLDHRTHLDAKDSLKENLDGLQWIRKEIDQPGSGGDKPKPLTNPVVPPADKLEAGWLFPGKSDYRKAPMTVSLRASLPSAASYNILVASDTKASGEHWEIFTTPGNGQLSVYMPGYAPNHLHSGVSITDGKPHTIAFEYAGQHVALHIDGKKVSEQSVRRIDTAPVAGEFAIGRLVSGQLRHRGVIHWVHLAKGTKKLPAAGDQHPKRDANTIALFTLKASGKQMSNQSSLAGDGAKKKTVK